MLEQSDAVSQNRCDSWQQDTHVDIGDYELFSFAINGVLLSSIISCGIVGNSLIVIVLCRQKLRNYLSPYFAVLALWDVLLLVASFPVFAYEPLRKDNLVPSDQLLFIYKYFYPVAHVFHTESVWTLVLLSFERYLGICHPLKNNRRRSTPKPSKFNWILFTLVSVSGVIFSIPRFFEITSCQASDKSLIVTPTSLRLSGHYQLIYNVILRLVCLTVGPFFLMFILTCLICVSLRNSQGLHQAAVPYRFIKASRKRLETTMNSMLIADAVKFLLSMSLTAALDFCELILSTENLESLPFVYVVDISNVIIILSSSLNFFVYWCCGSKFRSETKNLLRDVRNSICSKKVCQRMSRTFCQKQIPTEDSSAV